MADYFPGVLLPPHLSPFVTEQEGDYVPPEKLKLLAMQRGENPGVRGPEAAGAELGGSAEPAVGPATALLWVTVASL